MVNVSSRFLRQLDCESFYEVISLAFLLEKFIPLKKCLKYSPYLYMLDFSANYFIFVELIFLYGKSRYLTTFFFFQIVKASKLLIKQPFSLFYKSPLTLFSLKAMCQTLKTLLLMKPVKWWMFSSPTSQGIQVSLILDTAFTSFSSSLLQSIQPESSIICLLHP